MEFMNRREALKSAGSALVLLGSGLRPVHAFHSAARRAAESNRPYLSAALLSAAWLKSVRQETAHGVTWPQNPLQPNVIPSTVYHGPPGILPFLLELHAATGDEDFLKEAKLGADHLIATALTEEQMHDPKGDLGFYIGLGGLAYVMERVHQVSGDSKYRQHAQRCVDVIDERTHAGTTWPDDNDVMWGAAGAGLFLLWWSRTTHDRKAMPLARTAGQVLMSRGQAAPGGLSWKLGSKAPKYYPNFSHGTAGVAYFLAALSKASGEKAFLQTALQGASHLQAITTCNSNGCLIHHHEPEGEQLYYLGWCHGPAGTSRLHRLLAHLTRDRAWRDTVFRSADGVLHSGIPEKSTEGFWNNVSMCCGTASVAAYMLSLYQEYGDRRYLDFSCHMTDDLLHRATQDEHGMRWVQAENRISPNEVIAQTGYMQGAAGIGTWLLRLDGHFQRRTSKGIFPDDISV